MTPSNRKTLFELSKFGDIALLFGCLDLSYAAANGLNPTHLLTSMSTTRPVPLFIATLLLGVAWHCSLSNAHLYRSHRLTSFRREVLEVALGCCLSAVFSLCWLLFLRADPTRKLRYSLIEAALFAFFSILMLSGARGIGRFFTRLLRRHGHNLRHVIIVGTNSRATDIAEQLQVHASGGYKLQGFVDNQWWNKETREANQHKLLADFETLPQLLRTITVDEVIIALPIASFYRELAGIVKVCMQHGIIVRSAGTFGDVGNLSPSNLLEGPNGTLVIHDASWDAWSSLAKRVFDIGASVFLLVLLSPILLLAALLIKLTSPGPILFKQTRLGLGKRPFSIYKFRTMVVDAERLMRDLVHLNESEGPTFKLRKDPRITKCGAFLRKTSIDELPQLLNVVLGDMSLVGPRPLPIRDVSGFSEDWHRRRFSVKPGITCLWQVMGRSSIGFHEWMELDMRYIDQWSIWLDLKILLRTIPAVLRGSGAM